MIKHKGEDASSELTIPPGKVITLPVVMKKGDQIVDVHTGKVLATAMRDVSPAPVKTPTSSSSSKSTASSQTNTSTKNTSTATASSHSVWGTDKSSGPMVQTDYASASSDGPLTNTMLAVVFAIVGVVLLGWGVVGQFVRKND